MSTSPRNRSDDHAYHCACNGHRAAAPACGIEKLYQLFTVQSGFLAHKAQRQCKQEGINAGTGNGKVQRPDHQNQNQHGGKFPDAPDGLFYGRKL